ncbi:3-oxoacyl-[acyl-carrier-protein] reductase FabG [Pigmentiphaga humi]|uniref:3-oxoacyl-[acyl-carrier-protein] reductase FabG n=1 Tax=Pigmentiphaga humi TaxID=2478468 RepID=A0A3P4B118_9BURK|nr:SDR family oxidoreductase [Pigmentiphaga humi]VCU69430.1 3-oxoacyl-[acyl-carrier-protein] reductase FabG [Pigmentiphaga humi]
MLFESEEFAGAAVVLVGGALGSGPELLRAFAACGAKVVVGVTPAEDAAHAAAVARDVPGASCIPVDIDDETEVERFFDACTEQLGGLDILVNVAAPVSTADALEIPAARYRDVLARELMGPILCIQAAARRMKEHGAGRIVSFSSMSGKTGVHRHVAPYAAAKGGLIAYSRVMAAELAPYGVTVNVIATSLFDVQVAGASAERMQEVVKGIPVGRVGRSIEAAHAVFYLASRHGAYVTGETLNLSGGRFMD